MPGPGSVTEVVKHCRREMTGKPMFVKLTNEGVLANSLAAEESGADGLTLINTLPALSVDHKTRKVLRGGLSGPAVKPVALRAVYEVSRAVDTPVIGCGGVSTGTDVAEFYVGRRDGGPVRDRELRAGAGRNTRRVYSLSAGRRAPGRGVDRGSLIPTALFASYEGQCYNV